MPRVEPLGRRHPRQQPFALGVLDRDRPDSPPPVPGEQLVEREAAEAAVAVVEQDQLR
jgi:hypothetical protein